MVSEQNEKMEKNEKNETVFFRLYYLCLILWKTGGPLKKGQFVCKYFTLSVGVSWTARSQPYGAGAGGFINKVSDDSCHARRASK